MFVFVVLHSNIITELYHFVYFWDIKINEFYYGVFLCYMTTLSEDFQIIYLKLMASVINYVAPLSLFFVCTETQRLIRMNAHIQSLQHRLILSLSFQDFLFHGATFVFYFGAFLLQAATTSLHNYLVKSNSTTLLSDHDYNISIAASVSIS